MIPPTPPLGGALNDLPTDDPVFILEQIAEQAEADAEKVCDIAVNLRQALADTNRNLASLARQMAKGVA